MLLLSLLPARGVTAAPTPATKAAPVPVAKATPAPIAADGSVSTSQAQTGGEQTQTAGDSPTVTWTDDMSAGSNESDWAASAPAPVGDQTDNGQTPASDESGEQGASQNDNPTPQQDPDPTPDIGGWSPTV